MINTSKLKIGIISSLSLNYVHCNMLCGELCFTENKNNKPPMDQRSEKIIEEENNIKDEYEEENNNDYLKNDLFSFINKDINKDNKKNSMLGSTNEGSTYTKANYNPRFSPDYTSSSTTYGNRFDAKTTYGINPFLTQKDLFNHAGETKTGDTYSKTEYYGKNPGYESSITPDDGKTPGYESSIIPDGCSKNDDITQNADNRKC